MQCNDILNSSYKERVTRFSSYLRDQLETPKERAVLCAEYVIRHKGARHLRSAARKLNFFQYYCLDVIATILSSFILIFAGVAFLIKKALRMLTSRVHKATYSKKVQ